MAISDVSLLQLHLQMNLIYVLAPALISICGVAPQLVQLKLKTS
jgi:hypothetical protein